MASRGMQAERKEALVTSKSPPAPSISQKELLPFDIARHVLRALPSYWKEYDTPVLFLLEAVQKRTAFFYRAVEQTELLYRRGHSRYRRRGSDALSGALSGHST